PTRYASAALGSAGRAAVREAATGEPQESTLDSPPARGCGGTVYAAVSNTAGRKALWVRIPPSPSRLDADNRFFCRQSKAQQDGYSPRAISAQDRLKRLQGMFYYPVGCPVGHSREPSRRCRRRPGAGAGARLVAVQPTRRLQGRKTRPRRRQALRHPHGPPKSGERAARRRGGVVVVS